VRDGSKEGQMKNYVTRRDFLKLAGLLPLSITAPSLASSLNVQQNYQNVIVIVFDALSAYNISVYGYQRDTMPNLAKLSERAVVYHNHYAGGNFTTPGTASLLTGTLPWTHRAFRNNGTVEESFTKKNIFSAFNNHYRLTYSHNPWVYTMLDQFNDDLEDLIALDKFLLMNDFLLALFENDDDIAKVSWIRTIKRNREGYVYSLFLSHLFEHYEKYREVKFGNLKSLYPRGVPSNDYINYFLLEDVIDWLGNNIKAVSQPFLGYFHFWPPHEPYRTRQDFYGRFENDGYKPIDKPHNPFSYGPAQKDPLRLPRMRTEYDEFILYADSEFGRLYNYLERSGLLNNTWVVLTSDHGELFERGIEGHSTSVLYQPLIRIPLLIFEPKRTTRTDIFSPTSAIDVLPTLLHVTGYGQAPWSEGTVLPPFAPAKNSLERNLYTLEARTNEQFSPITVATTTLIKGNYKLIYYFGYDEWGENGEHVELYDFENDPEELNNMYLSKKDISMELLNELKEKIAQVNETYK
jgi:arylsulfatase A-like enzyme